MHALVDRCGVDQGIVQDQHAAINSAAVVILAVVWQLTLGKQSWQQMQHGNTKCSRYLGQPWSTKRRHGAGGFSAPRTWCVGHQFKARMGFTLVASRLETGATGRVACLQGLHSPCGCNLSGRKRGKDLAFFRVSSEVVGMSESSWLEAVGGEMFGARLCCTSELGGFAEAPLDEYRRSPHQAGDRERVV